MQNTNLNAFVKAYFESFCSEEKELIDNLSTELTSLVHSGTDVDEAIQDRLDSMVYIYWSDLKDFAATTQWAVEEVVQQHLVELSETYSYFNHLQTAHEYYLDCMFAEDRTEIITALFLMYLHENNPDFTKDDFESFLEYHDMDNVVGFDEFEELKEEFFEELKENSEEDAEEE